MILRIKISELMGKHKMSQQELSRRTGIRAATISLLYHEKAKRIEVTHIVKLCEVLQCQPSDLLELTEES